MSLLPEWSCQPSPKRKGLVSKLSISYSHFFEEEYWDIACHRLTIHYILLRWMGQIGRVTLMYICCCCCLVTSVVSDSVRPQRRQPTRLPCPWDSPGKNTGVGCHFLLQCMKVKSESEVAQSCLTLSDPMDCRPPGSSIHGIFQARVLEWGAIAFSIN